MYRKISSYIFLTLFSYSSIFGNEIWEKEIPPSHYLENFAVNGEKKAIKSTRYLSYGSFLGGIILGNMHTTPEQLIVAGILTVGGVVGIIYDLRSDIKTQAFKEFQKIENLEDSSQKEKLAYEALISLAEEARRKIDSKKTNRKSNRNNNPLATLVAAVAVKSIIDNNPKIFLTPEEKVLDNYLNQIPIK